jgi:hypothetical protein
LSGASSPASDASPWSGLDRFTGSEMIETELMAERERYHLSESDQEGAFHHAHRLHARP